MKYQIDSEVAELVGVNAAIIFENIAYWVRKNIANEVNIHDGNVWTYNSMRAYEELIPFLSHKQIRIAIDKLKENGLIVTGNYNKNKMDKTQWYALTPQGQRLAEIKLSNNIDAICPTTPTEAPFNTNGFAQKGKAIPKINQLENISLKKEKYKKEKKEKANEEIVSYLNAKAKTNFRASSNKTKSLINARLNEGFKLDDFKRVIDNKTEEWLNDPKMSVYLRPETLFSNKFEGYLNQKQGSTSTYGWEVETW